MKIIYINSAAREQAEENKEKIVYGPAIGSEGEIINYEEEYGDGK